jgi:hypothetical protein
MANQNLVADCEVALNQESNGLKNRVANIIRGNITKKAPTAASSGKVKTLMSIISAMEEEQLTMVKADKGNRLVILDKGDYKRKGKECILSHQFEVLGQDPIKDFQKRVKTEISSCFVLLNDTTVNTLPPRLYGLPKLQKKKKFQSDQ